MALPKPPRHPLISLPGLAATLALNIGAVYGFEHFLNGISVQPRLPTLVHMDPPPIVPVHALQGAEPLPADPALFADAPAEPFPGATLATGQAAPAYPAAYAGTKRPGRVLVDCVFDPSGAPASCRAAAVEGGDAFAEAALGWLNGPDHPVYKLKPHTGWAQHDWTVTFKPTP